MPSISLVDEKADEAFLFEIQGDTLTIDDSDANPDTVVRDAGNLEINKGAGSNTIRLQNLSNSGPNIDSLSISGDEGTTQPEEPTSELGERFKINFQPDGFATPDGYAADTGLAFGEQSVKVTDSRLTLDSIGMNSTNTEIQYLEIQALPDLTPQDDRDAPQDYASFTEPRAIAGVGANEVAVNLDPQDGSAPTGVDPSSDIFLGISVVEGRGGALLESLQDGSVRLFETVSGKEVALNVNTTGGFDSLTISPTGGLKAFTGYTLAVDGFKDRGDNDNRDAPTREFQAFTNTFVTGQASEAVSREVAFNDVIELNGAVDGAFGFTSLEISPDGLKMYIATMTGDIKRYDVDPITGGLYNGQMLSLNYFDQSGSTDKRGIIGLTFDPNDPNTLWVSDNYPIPLSGRYNGVPDFSGRVSKITLGEGEDFSGTAETYVTGLPRSNGDHVTNSLEFRANPDYDVGTNPDVPSQLLYLIQGSNSAMGEPDSAWGFRPERLLNASVMEIDPTRDAPEGGFDVSTEPLSDDDKNRRFEDRDGDPKNGPMDMGDGQFLVFAENGTATVQDAAGNVLESFYDPFADDAVVKLFATGARNAYDLVWHSNGFLYAPTNGSAAGGNSPDDPATPHNENVTQIEKQDDYLFKIEEGGYYGYPNKLRSEYILNGGNPTSGKDTNQVDRYPEGTQPDSNYRIDDTYSLGENRSPNGATEYTRDVFGGNLRGNVLFAEYSGGDDIRSIALDDNGNVAGDDVLRDVNGRVISYIDPLDIIENPATGQLYLLTLNRGNGQSQIVRLDPSPGGMVPDPVPVPIIEIQSNDAAYFSDRLQFNYLENNNASNSNRDFKESGSVVISNTGTAELSVLEANMTGPFALAQPDIFNGLTLGAGESITVDVLFDRGAYSPPVNNADDGMFKGALRVETNDADTPVAEVDLAGFWQKRDEGGWEPNVNEVWEVFGFGNVIEGLSTQGGGENSVLNDFDLYRPVNDDEVLSRDWKIADGFESAKITQIAAFHGDGGATLGFHNPGNKNDDIILTKHAVDNNQSLLPIESDGQFATTTITQEQIPDSWGGDDIFGIEVANLSTDPSLNPSGAVRCRQT